MNIVVSGSSSFVGYNVVRELISKYPNDQIYCLVRPNSKHNIILDKIKNYINIIEIDMSYIENIKFEISKIDVFYMIAWRGTRGEDREDFKMQQQNYLDSLNACKTAISMGAHTIIGVGSQAEYGIVHEYVDETYNPNPNTEYGKFKLKLYEECLKLCSSCGVAFKWGRIFSAYGVGDYDKTLIMYCIKQMIDHKEVKVSSCTQKRNYINIIDVAKIFVCLLQERIPSGAYNIASNDTRTLKDFLNDIKSIINYNEDIIFGEINTNNRVVSLNPNINKLIKYITNYKFVPFSEGVNEIYKTMLEDKKC